MSNKGAADLVTSFQLSCNNFPQSSRTTVHTGSSDYSRPQKSELEIYFFLILVDVFRFHDGRIE